MTLPNNTIGVESDKGIRLIFGNSVFTTMKDSDKGIDRENSERTCISFVHQVKRGIAKKLCFPRRVSENSEAATCTTPSPSWHKSSFTSTLVRPAATFGIRRSHDCLIERRAGSAGILSHSFLYARFGANSVLPSGMQWNLAPFEHLELLMEVSKSCQVCM